MQDNQPAETQDAEEALHRVPILTRDAEAVAPDAEAVAPDAEAVAPDAEPPAPGANGARSAASQASDAPRGEAAGEPLAESAGETATMDTHDGQPMDEQEAGASAAPLPPLQPGETLGAYTVLRRLRKDEGGYDMRTRFLARGEEKDEEKDNGADAPVYVLLIEGAPEAFAPVEPLLALGLRHGRLLAPRAVLHRGAEAYLVVETLLASDPGEAADPALLELAPTVAQGAQLDPLAALRAGAGLADALNYLHRSEVAHLHVGPDALVVRDGRAYLSGVETARYLGEMAGDLEPLFARDANYLARSLAPLAGLAEDQPLDLGAEITNAEQGLRQIAAHGAADGFPSLEEVASACGAVLYQFTHVAPPRASDAAAATARLRAQTGAATSVGQVRSENQDAFASTVLRLSDDLARGLLAGVCLVADGMGGEASGEVASRIAARTITGEMARHFLEPSVLQPLTPLLDESDELFGGEAERREATAAALAQKLVTAVNAANQRIRLFSGQLALASGRAVTSGTTVTALAFYGARAALAHIGDSRAYLLRGERLSVLTEDHSVLARLQALDHPILNDPDMMVPRSMLYRSLGQQDENDPDLSEFLLEAGDRLMLCSDGLWDELDDETIQAQMRAATDPQGCAEALVALANEAGGHDNCTALALFIERDE